MQQVLLNLAGNANLKALYLDNERYDGYFRDKCVFRPDIEIEDTMNVIVKYDTGATLSYTLNAFNAWEGYQIAFNGTKGRLDLALYSSFTVRQGKAVLWYPERKFFLLGRVIVPILATRLPDFFGHALSGLG